MTARVINDPGALGWEFDPATGRWEWGGSSSGGSGVEEAPEDGKQYARSNASWEQVSAATVDEDEPADPAAGQLWYKPSEGAMYVYDGSDWESFGSGSDGGDVLGEAILVVGGGGAGGGIYAGGGGGGGGVVLVEQEILVGAKYQIAVGSGESSSTISQSNGTPSSVTGPDTSILAEGGGSGGNYNLRGGAGAPGASGGGHCYNVANGSANAPGIDGQGHEGGGKSAPGIGSGGGGAGEPGHIDANGKAGRGGDGRISRITGDPVHYAGGGAGGVQGGSGTYAENVEASLGGGGSWLTTNGSGEAGLGGGGAGCQQDQANGGRGGTGVVIIRTRRTIVNDIDFGKNHADHKVSVDLYNIYTFKASFADIEFT